MTPPMTQPDLARLEGLLKAASALPWREEESEQAPFLVIRAPYDGDVDGDGRSIIVGGEEICRFTDQELDIENSELIVAAVNSLPALLARVRELESESAAGGRILYRMQTDNAALVLALKQCRGQFQFYANEHTAAGKTEKAATNQLFADLAGLALNKEPTDADR